MIERYSGALLLSNIVQNILFGGHVTDPYAAYKLRDDVCGSPTSGVVVSSASSVCEYLQILQDLAWTFDAECHSDDSRVLEGVPGVWV